MKRHLPTPSVVPNPPLGRLASVMQVKPFYHLLHGDAFFWGRIIVCPRTWFVLRARGWRLWHVLPNVTAVQRAWPINLLPRGIIQLDRFEVVSRQLAPHALLHQHADRMGR